jgi:biotin transport system substrate-specific component
MFVMNAPYPVLVDGILSGRSSASRKLMLVVGGSFALWLSAKLQVPFYPVPITMQTFVVLVIGMAFGARLAAATLALYLVEGAFGLPVFAGTPEKGVGILYMVGPTGGYLVGQLLAATLVGWLATHGWDRSVHRAAAAMFLGNVVIYVPGLLWLAAVVGWDRPILQWGLEPFIVGDIFKLALAATVMPVLRKVTDARGK